MTVAVKAPHVSVPKLWPGGTIGILASGPSLTQEDADYLRRRVDAVIAINATYGMAPWADCLYGSDGHKFWTWHQGVPDFQGMRYTLKTNAFGVPVLRNTGSSGLELDPTGLRTGLNSGYAAINVAVHLGAKRVVIVGLDMKPGPKGQLHWHKDHPSKDGPPFEIAKGLFKTIVAPLQEAGVEVINCTRSSALTVFPRVRLEDAL